MNDEDLIEVFRQAQKSSDLTRTERLCVLGALAFTFCAVIGTLIFDLM